MALLSNALAIAGAIPPGTVLPFAGTTAPSGYLICDTSTPVSRTTYAALFAAIGTVHGNGDGSTSFHLPDYRGRFLRGRANLSANDPDRASRTASNSGGSTGDNVGSVQGQATAQNGLGGTAAGQTHAGSPALSVNPNGDHTHTFSGFASVSWATGSGNLTKMQDDGGSVSKLNTTGSHGHTGSVDIGHTHAASSLILSGDNESRPVNAYVNYIIKT